MDALQAFQQANGLATPLYPPTSRYHGIATAQFTTADGRVITYLRRRFLPSPERFATLAEHRVVQGERIDALAARTLNDPEQYWRLCDANGAMDPADLTSEVGRRIRICLPEGIPGDDDAG